MSQALFGDEIRIRSDTALRKAVYAAARRENTTASEFIRRLLRKELTAIGMGLDVEPVLAAVEGTGHAVRARHVA